MLAWEANIYTVHKINIYSNAAEYEYFNIWQTSAISQQQTLNVAYLRFCPLGELNWLEKTKTETSEAKSGTYIVPLQWQRMFFVTIRITILLL